MSSMPSTPNQYVGEYVDELGRTDAEVYLTGIYDGEIVASKWMRKLAEMLLPRFHEEYHGYHFNEARAARPCFFLEHYCVIPEGDKMWQPFVMEQFQKACVQLAYGFVDENEIRQYSQVVYCLGRKNGKSSLIAGLGLYHLTSDGEKGGEVYCCATSEQQSRKIMGAADSMAFHSPFLKNRIRRGMSQKTGRSALNYDKTGSMLSAIAASPKKRDGASCSALLYDELAAVEDNGYLLDQMEESMSARREPMTWILSSENFVRNGIWDERISYCKSVIDGKISDDSVLPLLFVQDDRSEVIAGFEAYERGDRPEVWLKANPGLFVIKDVNKLAQRVRLSINSPRRLPSVLTKEFCLRSGSYSAFLDIESCINETPIDFSEIGIPPYVCVGFDLASKNDLCAAICRWRVPGDNNIYELAKFWVASEMINMQTDSNQKDNVPYLTWSSQGQPMDGTLWHYVDIVEGDRVNQSVVIDFLNDLVSVGMYPFCVAYDPWHVDDFTDRTLRRLVGDSRVVPVPQTARVLSPLMREHELDLKARKVICPNPCLHHSRQSLQAREDAGGNLFPQKKDLQPNQKIDGIMSEFFVLSGYKKFEEEYLSAIGWEPPELSSINQDD